MKPTKSPTRCLFLLDCKNLLLSVKNLYGNDSRLDFKKLMQVAFRDLKTDGSNDDYGLAYAYIDFGSQWITALSHVLSTVGYRLRAYGPHIGDASLVTSWIIVDCMSQFYDYDKVIVASGRGDLVPLYEHLLNKGKEVEVMAFPDDISSQIRKYVSRVVELDDSVLLDPEEAKTEQP